MMSEKITIKNDTISTYLNTDDGLIGFTKAVDNGQTRLALQVLVEVIEQLVDRVSFLESFIEEEKIIRIRSLIMVERETQKGIIIGHKGTAIKRVGAEARKDLEFFFGKKIFIELYVKVNKNWRSNDKELKRFGYNQK